MVSTSSQVSTSAENNTRETTRNENENDDVPPPSYSPPPYSPGEYGRRLQWLAAVGAEPELSIVGYRIFQLPPLRPNSTLRFPDKPHPLRVRRLAQPLSLPLPSPHDSTTSLPCHTNCQPRCLHTHPMCVSGLSPRTSTRRV